MDSVVAFFLHQFSKFATKQTELYFKFASFDYVCFCLPLWLCLIRSIRLKIKIKKEIK